MTSCHTHKLTRTHLADGTSVNLLAFRRWYSKDAPSALKTAFMFCFGWCCLTHSSRLVLQVLAATSLRVVCKSSAIVSSHAIDPTSGLSYSWISRIPSWLLLTGALRTSSDESVSHMQNCGLRSVLALQTKKSHACCLTGRPCLEQWPRLMARANDNRALVRSSKRQLTHN